jgi:hypothetical protein
MIRLFGPGFVGLIVLALWVYCVLDAIATDEALIRNLPKFAWLVVILLFGPVGCIAWLALGRPAFAGWRPGDTAVRPARPVRGPEDIPGFAPREIDRAARDRERAERVRRWEEQRRRAEEAAAETDPEPDDADDGATDA